MATPIEGYASLTSAVAGDFVDFHVRADAAHRHFAMQIVRRGVTDEVVATAEGDAFVPGPQDDATLAVRGCDWLAVPSCRTTIAPAWRSGYYVAKLIANGESTALPFFVRSAAPGTTSRVLLKMSDSTAQAYTGWGGRGFYTTPNAPVISFDRPYDDMDLFERYQLPFIRWTERNGIVLDYCSSLDLHRNPLLLAPYRLLVSLGHDEYWSLEMRDQVEAFITNGGNVAFLSANTCYWQIRLDLGNGRRLMTCYKETEGHPPDPERNDPRRLTVRWYEPPVSRPEARMTGVSYRSGAGWWIDPIVPAQRFRGYTVARPEHWVFAGTGVSAGAVFGNGTSVDDTILGYETDAVSEGTPADFVALASADLSDWSSHGQGGRATMGAYQHNGIVFSAGTVNWAGGLTEGNGSIVDAITATVFRELSREREHAFAVANAGFEEWANGVPTGWALDGAGSVAATPTHADAASNQMRFADGTSSLAIDASRGETWLSCSELNFDGGRSYGAGCWARTHDRGATIRLQTTDTWRDFATAAHSGSGEWEYLFATGSPATDAASVPARVKLQVAAGARAVYDDVCVIELK